MGSLLGIDVGTSSVKAAIFDEQGKLLAVASTEFALEVPRIGYAEQNPNTWWEGTIQAIQGAMVKADIPKERIACIGLSGQMHGLVALDRAKKPIRKAILHCDVRSTQQVEYIRSVCGEDFSRITYNPVFPGFQLVSLLWVRDKEPVLFEKICKVICPKDYIRMCLTSEIGTEATDASGTLAYDMKRQTWSGTILRQLSIDQSIFPEEIHNSYEVAGEITTNAAKATGLLKGTPVVYGGGDQAMHSLGNGVFMKGVITTTIGTSGQVVCLNNHPEYNPLLNTHTMRHVMPNTWYGMAAVLNAGVTLNWYRRNFAEGSSYDELVQEASRTAPLSDGLVFFPCMMGERTPYMDAQTRGMLIGMSLAHTRAHVVRAVMEGVSYAMKDSMEILERLYPGTEKYICAGGGAINPIWRQIQADIYNRILFTANTPEQACTGAAIVAGVGCGIYGTLREGCEHLVNTDAYPTLPIAENVTKYDAFRREVYDKLYEQNRMFFPLLANY